MIGPVVVLTAGMQGPPGVPGNPGTSYLTPEQAADLTDAGDSILHHHAADRDRANHTGTQSADTLTNGAVNKVYTATEQTRLANTSGANTGDQDLSGYELLSNKATSFATVNDALYPSVKAVKDYTDGLVVGLLDDRGSYDASVNTFPATGGSGTAGAVLKGDLWYIGVAGALGGAAVSVGDSVRALQDTPGQTASNWSVLESNIGYVPENTTNKSTSVESDKTSDIKFPSVKSLYDWAVGLFAPKASPALTGVPTAPTAAAGTNTTQISTTAFVLENSVSTAEGYTLYAPLLGGEPQGFVDSSQLTLSWNDATRTLTLTPVGANFQFYANSILHSKTVAESLVVANTQGMHYVYYDENGVLSETDTYTTALTILHAIVATLEWNATTGKAVPDALIELHGCKMPAVVHMYLHLTQGTRYQSGLAPTVVTEADGSLLLHAQASAVSGVIWDEDIQHTITSRAVTDTTPVMYRTGATGTWTYDESSSAVVRATGTGRAAFNEWTGATWQLTEVPNNDFVLAHLYAIPGITKKWMVIMGQHSYATIPAARAGASSEIIGITGLPTPEYKSVATLLLQTSDLYTNAVKSRLRDTATGEAYVDWRSSIPIGTAPATSHDSMSGIDTGDIQHIPLTLKTYLNSFNARAYSSRHG